METEVESLHVMRERAEALHEAARAEVWFAEEVMRHILDHLNECVQEVSSTSRELEARELEAIEGRLRQLA